MRRSLILLVLTASILLLVIPSIYLTSAAPSLPPTPGAEDDAISIEKAIEEATDNQRETVLAYLVYDIRVVQVQVSEDGQWGLGYLDLIEPDTGQPLPIEPGLAIAVLSNDEWQVTLPADPGWLELLNSVPDELLSPGQKTTQLEMNAAAIAAPDAVYSGYLLPWEAGKTVYVSQTVGHDQYTPSGSAHFAFDFYVPQTMFRLYASKAGTVWRARWDVPNGNASDMGNYLVLMDTTTSPVTYQLYLHLAQDSIPQALRTTGTYVAQGQFIGMADDTGQSTGHHLHYQVHTNPASYWGTSVDITFNEVDINGGRPRILSDKPYCKLTDVCAQFRTSYVSANVIHGDTTPPDGGLFEPANGFAANNKTLHVEGWASDIGSGVDKARLTAYFNDTWNDVGPEFSTLTFAMDWDMCSSGVPDGPVTLAMAAWDNEGNPAQGFPGLTHIIKNYDCTPPPPTCVPGNDQVSIYSETDYRGNCQKLGVAQDYSNSSSFTTVGDNNVESIQVGSNVLATLYSDPNFSGRSNTYLVNDSNLDDNPIGRNKVSSIKVLSRSIPPAPPSQLVAPLNGSSLPGYSSLSLSWRDPGGASQYQVRLEGQLGQVDSPWMTSPFWHLDSLLLTPGNYTWKVRSRNCPETACQSAWSQTSAFSITAPPAALIGTNPPFSDGVETGTGNWRFSGLWNRLNDASRSRTGSYSWYYGQASVYDYANGSPNTGDLTLRPVTIPASGYALRFWYNYETEGPEPVWDQRWVQISSDGGPFVNVLQLQDDVPDYWLRATLDLTPYAGKTIQVRFHFETLDDQFNTGNEGWYLDDIEISSLVLPACSDDDNEPAKATILEFGIPKNGQMCPSGDADYYRFEGTAGDRIVLDVDTPADNPVGGLDLILYLLDGDGSSVLAIHDDEIYAEKLDPHLGYKLVRSGTYYVKTRLWAHPTFGDVNFTYQLTLSKDNQKPSVDFANPLDNAYLPDSDQLMLSLNASDNGSGISEVQFLYHSGDWAASTWQVLGTDMDGSNGWSYTFDITSQPEQKNIVFFANIYDWAGNWFGTGAWNLGIDRTPPLTALTTLAASQQSTAVNLHWSGSDNLSGIDHYDLQVKPGSGTWADSNPDPTGTTTNTWFIGQPATNYGFRLRGVDLAGNIESFPASAETTTAIPSPDALCSAPDAWDLGGDDNSSANATPVEVAIFPETHNFCNPLTPDRLSDEDWVSFIVEQGVTYDLEAIPGADMMAGIIELYAADGSTLIASASSGGFGAKAHLVWTSDRNGQVYLRVRHTDGRVAGNIVSYQLLVARISPVFLPLVNR